MLSLKPKIGMGGIDLSSSLNSGMGGRRPLLAQAEAYWRADRYDGSGQILEDRSGHQHHMRLGSQYPAYVARGVGNLPGVAGNYFSTPDSAAVSITSDIDIVVHAALADWTPAAANLLVAKRGGTSSQFSYQFWIDTTGVLTLTLSGDGTAATGAVSSEAPTVTDGADLWVRAHWRNSDNRVQFFTAPGGSTTVPGSGDWTQLGTDQSIALSGIFDSTAALEIGARSGGASGNVTGRIFYAEVRNGIDGTAVAIFDPPATDRPTSWVASTGETWTVNSTAGVDSNDPKFLAREASRYVYLPGVSGNYLSVPDEAALDITGDIAVVFDGALDDWTPSASNMAFLSKFAAAGQYSYIFDINPAGTLRLVWSADGTATVTASSTVAPTITDGAALAVGVTRNATTGDVKFWTAPTGTTTYPGGAGWTQLGDTVASAAGGIFASTSQVVLGGRSDVGNLNVAGKSHRFRLYASTDGTLERLHVDTSVAVPTATTFLATTGQTVTINRSSSGRKTVVVDRNLFLFGTDDYMECPDDISGMLDFAAGDSFTLVAGFRRHGTPDADREIISKRPSGAGVRLFFSSGSLAPTLEIYDGTLFPSRTGPNIVEGVLSTVVGIRDVVDDTIKTYTNGSGNSSTDTTTGSFANTTPLRVGQYQGTRFADMEFVAAAIFRRALTPAEIALLPYELGAVA